MNTYQEMKSRGYTNTEIELAYQEMIELIAFPTKQEVKK